MALMENNWARKKRTAIEFGDCHCRAGEGGESSAQLFSFSKNYAIKFKNGAKYIMTILIMHIFNLTPNRFEIHFRCM
jgi:hypothetical protein